MKSETIPREFIRKIGRRRKEKEEREKGGGMIPPS